MYTDTDGGKRIKEIDMAEIDTAIARDNLESAIQYLCEESQAPGDEADVLAQGLGYLEGALDYLDLTVTQLCTNSA